MTDMTKLKCKLPKNTTASPWLEQKYCYSQLHDLNYVDVMTMITVS